MSRSTVPNEAERLLRALWRNLDDDPGYLELRPLFPERPARGSRQQQQQNNARRWWTLDDALRRLPAVLEWTAAHQLSAFYGVLPRRAPGAGQARDARDGAVVWADLDIAPKQAKERLDRFAIRPSMVVLTGRGVHAYWVLSEPSPPDVCAGVSKALAALLDSDRAVAHPGALLRLPGSIHPKRRRLVKLAVPDNGIAHHMEDLADCLGFDLDEVPSESVLPERLTPAQLTLGRRSAEPRREPLGGSWPAKLHRMRTMPPGGHTPEGAPGEGRPPAECVGRKVYVFKLGAQLGRSIQAYRQEVIDAARAAGLSKRDTLQHLDRGIRHGMGELGGKG